MPPVGVLVHTKIDDLQYGCRNEQKMVFKHNRWFTSLKCEMYVYYSPTHWAYIEEPLSVSDSICGVDDDPYVAGMRKLFDLD